MRRGILENWLLLCLTLGELFALAGRTQAVLLALFLAWVTLEQLSLLQNWA